MSAKNRGRLQVQGPDMEEPEPSRAWARKRPPVNAEGLGWLESLRQDCTRSQLRRRQQAFPRAERFIKHAKGSGLQHPVCRSFTSDGEPTSFRVDLEVIKGDAFS